MEIKIIRPPVPLLWLDTWAVVELAKAIKTGRGSAVERSWALAVVDQINELVNQSKLIYPQGHQVHEVELGGFPIEDILHLQVQLSRGITLHYHKTTKNLQTERTMAAHINRSPSVKYPWQDLFLSDPLKTLRQAGPIIDVHITFPEGLLSQFKADIRSTAEHWETQRQLSRQIEMTYEQRLPIELEGPAQAFEILVGTHPLPQDLLLAYLENVGKPMEAWSRLGGQPPTHEGLAAFFRSNEFKSTPSISIKARLIAYLLTGQERIRPSDVADINEISCLLPYAQVMVMDGAMRDKVVDKLKLAQQFGTQVVRLNQLPDLLKQLAA